MDINEFEYVNELNDKEIDVVLNCITEEINTLKEIKKNLIKFSYFQSINGKILLFKFKSIIDEVARISLEIDFLETKQRNYVKLKEKKNK